MSRGGGSSDTPPRLLSGPAGAFPALPLPLATLGQAGTLARQRDQAGRRPAVLLAVPPGEHLVAEQPVERLAAGEHRQVAVVEAVGGAPQGPRGRPGAQPPHTPAP